MTKTGLLCKDMVACRDLSVVGGK